MQPKGDFFDMIKASLEVYTTDLVEKAIKEAKAIEKPVPLDTVAKELNVKERILKEWIKDGLKHRRKGISYFLYWREINEYLGEKPA